MVDHGAGYHDWHSTIDSLITIEGDGVDSDSDGYADAKINPDVIRVDSLGSIYLIQSFDLTVLSTTSLIGTTLTVADANNSIEITFAAVDAPPRTIGLTGAGGLRTESQIRDEIINIINTEWLTPTTITEGPVIDNNVVNGTSFSLSALSGLVSVSSSASLQVTPHSNMLFSGSGFTRATPVIAPPPVIHGFSEIVSGTNTVTSSNGRPILTVSTDIVTDDIYLFEDLGDDGFGNDIFRTERISRSTFGFPVNYLPTSSTSMPSNRFPSISGDGRHVYFSSDAEGSGGLAFTNTNQSPDDTNTARDIYYFDRKTSSLPGAIISVDMLFPNDTLTYSFGPDSEIPIVVQVDYNGSDLAGIFLYQNGFFDIALNQSPHAFGSNRYTGVARTPQRGNHTYQAVAFNRNGQQIGASQSVLVSINDFQGSQSPNVSLTQPNFESITSTSELVFHATGTDGDGNFLGIQYYINGVPYGNEILRPNFTSPASASYLLNWTPGQPGVYSVFAIGRDNSGNYVGSQIYDITATTGSTGATILPVKPFEVIDLVDTVNSTWDFDDVGDGAINDIILHSALGFGYFSIPRVDIVGDGEGASFEAVVDWNSSSPTYGRVTDLVLKSGGTGYHSSTTQIRIIPVLQSVKLGEAAIVSTTYDLNQTGGVTATNYFTGQRYDGTLNVGAGYVTAPSFYPSTYATPNRLPLAPPQTGESSTSVLPLNTTLPAPRVYPRAVVSGGFNHAPLFVEFNVTETDGKVETVFLSINESTHLISQKISGNQRELVRADTHITQIHDHGVIIGVILLFSITQGFSIQKKFHIVYKIF